MEQVCAGILRRYGAAIGLPPTFTIYGTDEQVRDFFWFGIEICKLNRASVICNILYCCEGIMGDRIPALNFIFRDL